jgi:hypothetical protein
MAKPLPPTGGFAKPKTPAPKAKGAQDTKTGTGIKREHEQVMQSVKKQKVAKAESADESEVCWCFN